MMIQFRELPSDNGVSIPLTDEQKMVIAHDHGPGLVFAVAGSGKSTCLIHRIERLVRENIFAPDRILASSFNKLAVEDLRTKLNQWPYCRPVDLKTLHSLGFMILREARERAMVPLPRNDENNPDQFRSALVFEAIKVARQNKYEYAAYLNSIDIDDFINYVSQCKGNIAYADLSKARLPLTALLYASQAEAPDFLPWYLDLYRLYEKIRQEKNVITYDDMLLEGWESLVRYPALLARFQDKYSCIMVDEFQDINRVQDAMLDLLTARHRNYMAIGDDDQTIYEWRGANPNYILNFEKRYQAKKYLLSWNFRSTATQILLANEVIRHNQKRADKHLLLSRREPGSTRIEQCDDSREMALQISQVFQDRFSKNLPSRDAVVLVRFYAQTPPLERVLIEQKMAYRIEGGVPFYQRKEITLFLDYLKVGLWEEALWKSDSFPRSIAQEAWNGIYNRPTRYLRKDLAGEIFMTSVREGIPLSQSLLRNLPSQGYVLEKIQNLAQDIAWLGEEIQTMPASEVLRELDRRMNITDYLIEEHATRELKRETKYGIQNFFDYAEGLGSAQNLLDHIGSLAESHQSHGDDQHYVTIMTIHRSKGKEWELVLIPQVNQGILPNAGNENLEEERRLLYVAITRARESLKLYAIKSQKLSQFLLESGSNQLLADFSRTENLLRLDPDRLELNDLVYLLSNPNLSLFKKYLPVWCSTYLNHQVDLANRLEQLANHITISPSSEQFSILEVNRFLWKEIAGEVVENSMSDISDFPGLKEMMSRAGSEVAEEAPASFSEWEVRQEVIHREYGKGRVIRFFENIPGQPEVEIYFPPPHRLHTFPYPPPSGLFQESRKKSKP